MTTASLDARSFDAIAKLAYQECGLQLVSEKTSMIQSRLRHRLRALGLEDFSTYAEFVCSNEGIAERRQMISALTTNVSHFFREAHHFEMLCEKIVPPLIDKVRAGKKLRVWSAGCSNGQEPYSIVMSLLERYPELVDLDFRVLATDIDPKVVAFASEGQYPERLVGGVSPSLLKKYFDLVKGDGEPEYRVLEKLKSLVTFKELNLLASWPMKSTFDVIFCRNVVIYFDLATQMRLWPRFRQQLADGGHLFLGHSERIADPSAFGYLNNGPTSYRTETAGIDQ
jgi:chemotaxis protein methyltransferase CheR